MCLLRWSSLFFYYLCGINSMDITTRINCNAVLGCQLIRVMVDSDGKLVLPSNKAAARQSKHNE